MSLFYELQGFEARGTDLSNRIRSYEEILDTTRGDRVPAKKIFHSTVQQHLQYEEREGESLTRQTGAPKAREPEGTPPEAMAGDAEGEEGGNALLEDYGDTDYYEDWDYDYVDNGTWPQAAVGVDGYFCDVPRE